MLARKYAAIASQSQRPSCMWRQVKHETIVDGRAAGRNIGITCSPTVGGSGAVAAELGKQLARRGHRVHFVSHRLPFRLGAYDQNVHFPEVALTSYSLFEYPPHDLALAA